MLKRMIKRKKTKRLKIKNEDYDLYISLLKKHSRLYELPEKLKDTILRKNILSIFTKNFLEEVKSYYPEPDNTYKALKALNLTINNYETICVVNNLTIMDIAVYETKKFIDNIIIELEYPNLIIGEDQEEVINLSSMPLTALLFVTKKHELIKI